MAFRHARGINGTTLSCQTTESVIDLCSRLGFTIDTSKVDEDIADGSCTAGELAEEFAEFKRMEAEEEENPEYGAVPNARTCLAKWLGMDDDEDKHALDAVEYSMNLLIVLRKMQRDLEEPFSFDAALPNSAKSFARLGQEILVECLDGSPRISAEYSESHIHCKNTASKASYRCEGRIPTAWECHWWAELLSLQWSFVFGAFTLGVVEIDMRLMWLDEMSDRAELLRKYGRFGRVLGQINGGWISESEIRGQEHEGVQVVAKTLVNDAGREKMQHELSVLSSIPRHRNIVRVLDEFTVEPFRVDPDVYWSPIGLMNDPKTYTGLVMPKYDREWQPSSLA